MVRAHAVGADLSASHLFSFFSNSTITQNGTTALERAETLSAPPLLARPSAPRSLLERQANSFSLTLEQQQIDAVGHGFAESVSDGSALVFVLGAGALARNVRLGFTVGEGVFASLANMSVRTRVASSALGALALVGCAQTVPFVSRTNPPIPDSISIDLDNILPNSNYSFDVTGEPLPIYASNRHNIFHDLEYLSVKVMSSIGKKIGAPLEICADVHLHYDQSGVLTRVNFTNVQTRVGYPAENEENMNRLLSVIAKNYRTVSIDNGYIWLKMTQKEYRYPLPVYNPGNEIPMEILRILRR